MFLEADLEQKEVDPPLNHWCASGHQAPNMFRRHGPSSPQEPTRFFLVKGQEVSGIYCEPCLIVAHHVAHLKKEGKL
jgi:hypothetical protein